MDFLDVEILDYLKDFLVRFLEYFFLEERDLF